MFRGHQGVSGPVNVEGEGVDLLHHEDVWKGILETNFVVQFDHAHGGGEGTVEDDAGHWELGQGSLISNHIPDSK